MRRLDSVVCVSHAEARRVRAAGVPLERSVVIENAVSTDDGVTRNAADRRLLEDFFATPPQTIVVAAGRLSVEKGFDVFVDAAAAAAAKHPEVGWILFGEGPLRPQLMQQIAERNLERQFVLAGFRSDLGRLLPQADLLVLSSYTEGMPVIVLEALAAGVPVVATAVGGVPEVIQDGEQGYLVSSGDDQALAVAIGRLVADATLRRRLGEAGRQRISDRYSCRLQAVKYQQLFDRLRASRPRAIRTTDQADRRSTSLRSTMK